MNAGDFYPTSMTPEQAEAINPAKGSDDDFRDGLPAAHDDQLTAARGCVYGLLISGTALLALLAIVGAALGWWS